MSDVLPQHDLDERKRLGREIGLENAERARMATIKVYEPQPFNQLDALGLILDILAVNGVNLPAPSNVRAELDAACAYIAKQFTRTDTARMPRYGL